MGGAQSAEVPCIAFGGELPDQCGGAPGNKAIGRSDGARELLGAYRAHTIALETTHSLVAAIAEQASERLDRIEVSMKQMAVEQAAQRRELEGGLDALASRLQRIEDQALRVAAKQRALASALSGDAADEAPPPPPLPSRPVTLTTTTTTVAAAAVAPPVVGEAAPPGPMPGGMPPPGRAGVRRVRDGK